MLYHEEFLSQIRQDSSGVARLIYADWLEERGDPLGEFIRIQCELDGQVSDGNHHADLKSRERQLFREHRDAWIGGFADKVASWETEGGLVSGLTVSIDSLSDLKDLFQHAPIKRVTLTDVKQNSESCLDFLTEHRVEFVDFQSSWHYDMTNTTASGRHAITLGVWLENPPEFLRGLGFYNIGDEFWKSPLAGQLEELDVRQDFKISQWQPLVKSKHLKHLSTRQFCKGRNKFKSATELLRRLESLCVAKDQGVLDIIATAIHDLDKCPLRRLALTTNNIQPRDDGRRLKKLAKKGTLRELQELKIDREGWADESMLLSALDAAFWESLENLQRLSIRSCERSLMDFDLLFGSGRLANLRELFMAGVLSGHNDNVFQVHDSQLERLAKLAPASLQVIELKNNAITAEGLNALLQSPMLPQISWLDLQANDLGDQGANLLLSIDPWPRLSWLNVRANGISENLQQKLTDHFGDRILASRDVWFGQELTTVARRFG